MTASRRRSLWIIVFTVGFDALGFGIWLPLIPQLFTNPTSKHYLLAADTSPETGVLLIGLLTAVYPLMQFFSTPVLGQLSDRHGRRPVLAACLAGTAVACAAFAIGIMTKSLPLLFAARAVDGFSGGNVSVAHAAMADITEPKDRTKSFGLTMGAFGTAMVLGPLLGGTLADSSAVSWFSASTPFWLAAILAAVNALSVWYLLDETRAPTREPLQLAKNVRNLARAFRHPQQRSIFLTLFFAAAANAVFTTFFGAFLTYRFQWDEAQSSHFFGYIGVCIIVTQFVTVRFVAKRFAEAPLYRVTKLFVAFIVSAYVWVPSSGWMFVIAPCVATFNGLSWVNLNGLLSRSAAPEVQGEVMGIGQSIQSLANVLPPLVAGSIASVTTPAAAVLAAAVCNFSSWAVFMALYRAPREAPATGP